METPRLKGSFVWYDLIVPDGDSAIAFYSSVAGWGTEPFQPVPEMPPYTMWKAGDAPIGGIFPPPEGQEIPPHWLLYIGSDDVDASCAAIKENGGTVMSEPQDIPTVGRFAICLDPQGAAFAVFTPLEAMPISPPTPMHMSWNELGTTDAESALAFYRAVFGWGDAGSESMGEEMGDYHMFDSGAWPIGGAYTIPASMAGVPPHWCPYIMTTDLDAACERVKSGGGQILNGPMEVPGGDRVAVCMDNLGAAFGLHEASGDNG